MRSESIADPHPFGAFPVPNPIASPNGSSSSRAAWGSADVRPAPCSPPLPSGLPPPYSSAALPSAATQITNHSIKACRCALNQGPTKLREAAALTDSRPQKSRSSLARRSSVFRSPKSNSRC
ncbi:hypothetical protein C2845_PM08G15180 [Panicum miliaceum]|uniref:Uncharacterized protein n=1 Tax=Panicum miliaceum TaxID=4540 RepID=A0A3L6QWT4_PANMI|nr:hypothetical protein C2845_PM08G15180 [Panicum miliaceum]